MAKIVLTSGGKQRYYVSKWVKVEISGMGFRGVSSCNVDAKGRFAMPTKYRESLTKTGCNKCVMTIDTEDDCLLLYLFICCLFVDFIIINILLFGKYKSN